LANLFTNNYMSQTINNTKVPQFEEQ